MAILTRPCIRQKQSQPPASQERGGRRCSPPSCPLLATAHPPAHTPPFQALSLTHQTLTGADPPQRTPCAPVTPEDRGPGPLGSLSSALSLDQRWGLGHTSWLLGSLFLIFA